MIDIFDSLSAGLPLRTFMQYSFAFGSRLEATSDVMSRRFVSMIVPDNIVILVKTVREKFDPKPSEAAFLSFFRDNFRPEVASDIISGLSVDEVGLDVFVKFGDSRSSPSRNSRNIRADQFVMDERQPGTNFALLPN